MAMDTSASCSGRPGPTGSVKRLSGSCMLSFTVVLLAREGVDRGSGRCCNTGRGRLHFGDYRQLPKWATAAPASGPLLDGSVREAHEGPDWHGRERRRIATSDRPPLVA